MRQNRGPKLPAKLLDELDDPRYRNEPGKKRSLFSNRKERRKAERKHRKIQHSQPRSGQTLTNVKDDEGSETFDSDPTDEEKSALAQSRPPANTPKVQLARQQELSSKYKQSLPLKDDSRPPSEHISRKIKLRFEEDDAEIAALERKLGIRNKTLPKTFDDDGLGELLHDIDDVMGNGGSRKRKSEEDTYWLEHKRRKASILKTGKNELSTDLSIDGSDSEAFLQEDDETFNDDEEDVTDDESGTSANADGSEIELSDNGKTDIGITTTVKENPYAPPIASSGTTTTKYIPPSLRKPSSTEDESVLQIRRQTKGLLNRLSEANMLSILKDIEALYMKNPRQYVTSTLIDLLMELLCDPSNLQTTMIILHAGFIAAVYKIIGSDFGAQLVERVVSDFDRIYLSVQQRNSEGKECSNLMSLVAELYNYQVIGSNLVYDYIRLFLKDLSELNAELLLRIIRNSGPQLRQDDPSALKDIVVLTQKSVATKGNGNLSVRTKVMIDAINDLKNNRVKHGSVISEHTIRMKKTLGSLNSRNIKATEPLRIGLVDVRDTEKKGKWWLVGASWRNDVPDRQEPMRQLEQQISKAPSKSDAEGQTAALDLLQLAREQRMNTDIRRAIFVSIMSSSDHKDAYMRLMKLRLKRSQEIEIPRVLIHCAGAEEVYNPYYTFIARRLCADHRLRMAFQFGLWSIFRQMGEQTLEEDGDVAEQDDAEVVDMRKVVNLGKMFGNLIADGSMPITVLKILNFAYVQPKTKTFVEVLLVTSILRSQKKTSGQRSKEVLNSIFSKVSDAPQMAAGLQYFLTKIVGHSDLVGGEAEQRTVQWGSGVAGDMLVNIASTATDRLHHTGADY